MRFDCICVGLGCSLLVGVVGCSSSSSSPPAKGYVQTTASGASCDLTPTLFTIGSSSDPVVNGQNGASVSCSVKSSGGGFDVSLSIAFGSYQFSSHGHVAADDGVTPPGTLTADINDADPQVSAVLYDGTTCVLSYNSPGNGSVEPGRIWGRLTCTDLVDSAKNVTVNGNTQPMVCSGTASFLFADCSQ